MDIWPGRAVGWSMSDRMDAGLADEALKMAIARRRPPAGCTRHSDRGSQYVSLRLGRTMRESGIRPSMGASSPPWDNAAPDELGSRLDAGAAKDAAVLAAPLRLLHREEEQRDEEEQCERGCGARRMGGEAARQPPVGNGGEIESGDGGDGASAQKVIHWPGKCRAAKCPECQSADEGGDEDFHFSP